MDSINSDSTSSSTDILVPPDNISIGNDDYVQAQHNMELALQAVIDSKTQLTTAIQTAIQQADALRALAESRALAASEQARILAEQAKSAALDSTRYSQEARQAADTVRYHQSLLAGGGGSTAGTGV